LSKYYGLQPGEIEEMPLRKFHQYLNQSPSGDGVLNGGDPRMDTDEYAHAGENARDILRRYGVAVPGK
jgi:hypothetical protein